MATRIVLFIISMLAIGVSYADSGEQTDYLNAVDRVDEAIARQDWPEAEKLIISTLELDPENESNWMLVSNLGMIQYYQGKDSLALATLNTGIKSHPKSTTLLSNRARVLSTTGRPDLAIEDYNRIIELDSLNTDAHLNRGLMNLYFGDLQQAEADIEIVNQLAPNSSESWLAAATLYTILDRPREAIPYYNKLINERPTPEYYAARAFSFIATDNLADAADDIALGLELDDRYSELYLCRAMLNKRRFENDRSLTDAQRAIDLGADPKRVKQILGL